MKDLVPLIDSNVFLDVFLNRVDFMEESGKVLDYCMEIEKKPLVAAHSVTNMYYILRKQVSDELRREILCSLFDFFEVSSINAEKLKLALNRNDFTDFEDCLQNECAVKENADCIITRNKKDFAASEIPVYTPHEFLERVRSA